MGARRQGQGGHFPWKCCKVFCALAVTVDTCVLKATTKKVVKKVVKFFRKKCPGWKKNPAGATILSASTCLHSVSELYNIGYNTVWSELCVVYTSKLIYTVNV